MLDSGLIDHLDIDFSDLLADYDYDNEGIDINEIIQYDCVRNMFACAHLSTLTGGYFCKKAEKSDSTDEAVDYYREAINLINCDFEWNDHLIGMYQEMNNDYDLQILKKGYNYCLDSVSASINRRLNGSAEENNAKKMLVEKLEEMRTGINSAFEK